MRLHLVAFVSAALLAAGVPAHAGAPLVYAGEPTQGRCLAGDYFVVTFAVDPTTRSGTYQESAPTCNSLAVFSGGYCANALVCGGECDTFADGSATCWFGSESPSEQSPNYLHMDADGDLVGYSYGWRYAEAHLQRVA